MQSTYFVRFMIADVQIISETEESQCRLITYPDFFGVVGVRGSSLSLSRAHKAIDLLLL